MRRTRPVADRFWPKVERRGVAECWPWLASVRRKDEGYGAFWLSGRHQPAPRVAYELTHGPIAPGLVACHRCDNPRCCNPAHIFIAAPKDNDADRVAKGRQARGSRNAASKLTERQVWAIRRLRRFGVKPKQLCEWFGISGEHVWSLCNDPSLWKHIDDNAMAELARAEWGSRHAAR